MFSDTHCHFLHLVERGIALSDLLATMEQEKYRVAIDIGTKPGDLSRRVTALTDAGNGKVPPFVHFTCGIWPDARSIRLQDESLDALEKDILLMLSMAEENLRTGNEPLVALGECGLDRYWNGTGVRHDDMSEDGPGTDDLDGEEALFSRQIALAEKYQLPLIIHSRDSFDATLSIVQNMDYHHGVIHCYSYGIPEARKFLDLGWYISFPGNITFPKKSADIARIQELVSYIPDDRLLLETDAPYMTPVPHRGSVNTPWHVRFVYEKAAAFRNTDTAALAELVFSNTRSLFSFTAK